MLSVTLGSKFLPAFLRKASGVSGNIDYVACKLKAAPARNLPPIFMKVITATEVELTFPPGAVIPRKSLVVFCLLALSIPQLALNFSMIARIAGPKRSVS